MSSPELRLVNVRKARVAPACSRRFLSIIILFLYPLPRVLAIMVGESRGQDTHLNRSAFATLRRDKQMSILSPLFRLGFATRLLAIGIVVAISPLTAQTATPNDSEQVSLAIAPAFNPSKRWVNHCELLRERLRYGVGAAFEASGGGKLIPTDRVDAAFAARGLDERQSVPDATLAEIARELDATFLLSWEPFQDEELSVHLRLRLVSGQSGEVVMRRILDPPGKVALYGTFRYLFHVGRKRASEAVFEIAAPGRTLLAGADETTPTRRLARGLNELVVGHYLERRFEDVRARPGDAEAWAYLSRAYSRLAAALDSPSIVRKRMAVRALAASDLAREISPRNSKVRQAAAFAEWVNGLLWRANAKLYYAEKNGGLDAQSTALAALLRYEEPPAFEESNSASSESFDVDRDFLNRLRAKALAGWWRDEEAAEFGRPSMSIRQRILDLARETTLDKANVPKTTELDLRLFLRGGGEAAEALTLAAKADESRQEAPAGPGALLCWNPADRLAYTRALVADAWLVAWDVVECGPEEENFAREAFRFIESACPSSAPVLTAKALYFDIARDWEARNAALMAALEADPFYAPAGRLDAALAETQLTSRDVWSLYERVRSFDPFNARLTCWTAKHLTRLGQRKRAVTTYYAAREIAPRDPRPFIGLLDIHAKDELRTLGIEKIEEMVEAYAPTPALRLEAARIFFENGHIEAATTTTTALILEFPERFEPMALLARVRAFMGQKKEMVATVDRFVSMSASPADRSRASELKAELLARRGDAAEAADAYSEALETGQLTESILRGLAKAQKATGQTDEALVTFEALDGLGFHAAAALGKGRILLERGEAESAMALAEKSQTDEPKQFEGYELEVRVHHATGNVEGAGAALQRLAENMPNAPSAALTRSEMLTLLEHDQQAAAAAMVALNKRREAHPAPLLKAAVGPMLKIGWVEPAEPFLTRLKKIHFEDPEAHAFVAWGAATVGDNEKAQQHIEIALRIAPNHIQALALKDILAKMKDSESDPSE